VKEAFDPGFHGWLHNRWILHSPPDFSSSFSSGLRPARNVPSRLWWEWVRSRKYAGPKAAVPEDGNGQPNALGLDKHPIGFERSDEHRQLPGNVPIHPEIEVTYSVPKAWLRRHFQYQVRLHLGWLRIRVEAGMRRSNVILEGMDGLFQRGGDHKKLRGLVRCWTFIDQAKKLHVHPDGLIDR
jgi:hypothetical protein